MLRSLFSKGSVLSLSGSSCFLMITHNMKASLEFGTRTIMMHEEKVIMDLQGQERSNMTVDRLIEQFEKRSGAELDRAKTVSSGASQVFFIKARILLVEVVNNRIIRVRNG